MGKKKTTNKMNLNFVSFSTMDSSENPDSLNFSGVVGYVDTPSDYTPCGGVDGYATVISSDNLDVDSLVGSGVNASWSDWFAEDALKSHDVRFKIGVIDKAYLQGNEIHVEGHLWKNDFPDVCDTIECAKESLGFSVEVYFEGIKQNDDEKTLTGLNGHFTGVAILYKSKAAFQNTKFMCSIKEVDDLTEDMQTALDEQKKAYDEKFAALTESVESLKTSVEKIFESFQSKKDEAVENKAPEVEAPKDKMDFSAITDAVKSAIAEGFAEQKKEATVEPERKTVTEFSSTKQLDDGKEKTVMEMSAEIDNDNSLSANEKWSKQLKLWKEHSTEFQND